MNNVARFIIPVDPPDVRDIDTQTIELRITNAEREVFMAVADFTIALQHARDLPTCLNLHRRLGNLIASLGAVEDQCVLKADAIDQKDSGHVS